MWPRIHAAARKATAPTATPIPIDICCVTAEKLVAELISGLGMSTKASVLMLVNCIDRDKPCRNSTAIITTFGVCGASNPQASSKQRGDYAVPSSTFRKPKFRKTGVVTDFMVRLPANIARINRPD